MKRSALARCVLSIGAVLALLAGCSSPQTQGVPESGMRATRNIKHAIRPASSYQVLYSFTRDPHRFLGGVFPYAPLLEVNGTMYGTTSDGGTGCHPYGCGTVYSISPSGAKRVIYRFQGGSGDGFGPMAGLIDLNGTLYGTTLHGGGTGCDFGYGCGTVYSITPAGTETVLHKFTGPSYDGAYPDASLIDVNGILYGTTSEGGKSSCGIAGGCGTVYSITTNGSETVLHSFGGGKDGYSPIGLIDVNGTIYGTTFDGGSGCPPQGCGTFYSMSTGGSKKTLHVFGGGSKGRGPDAALIDVNGTLYGTTGFGGTGCFPFGCGTGFSVSLKGTTRVLYQFAGGSTDGSLPHGLTYMNGIFYGTTQNDGRSGCTAYNCGTVYSLSTAGQETVLHTFTDVPDGSKPVSELINVNGTLYGTTVNGGSAKCHDGCGTVFRLTP